MGAVTQLRIMGGAIVLSIATSVFNSYSTPRLMDYMSRYDITRDMIYSTYGIAKLNEADQVAVKAVLTEGFNRQMIVLSAFAAAQIPTSILLWRREPIRV
jgi:hypothetical protein